MYQQETIKPYNSGDKAQQVEQMFDNIAPTYDTLNHRLSWDIDKGWRRKAIRQLLPYRPQSLLDIATQLRASGLHEPDVRRQYLRRRDCCFRHT